MPRNSNDWLDLWRIYENSIPGVKQLYPKPNYSHSKEEHAQIDAK